MGGSNKKPQQEEPKKSIKEITKEFSKQIRKLQREFGREVTKLEFNNKKINNDLERMVKKKEPKSTMRIVAANIPRNNKFIDRYQKLDAQLSDITFHMNQVSTTETMVKVMTEMNSIMKVSNSQLDIKNVMQVMEQFNMQMEKNSLTQEQLQDVMDQDEDEAQDEDLDRIIRQVEEKVEGPAGGGGQMNVNQMGNQKNNDELNARIDALGL